MARRIAHTHRSGSAVCAIASSAAGTHRPNQKPKGDRPVPFHLQGLFIAHLQIVVIYYYYLYVHILPPKENKNIYIYYI